MTTRFAGELPLDAMPARSRPPTTPASPEPSLLEVTQPFMPAIREQAPEFTKRLSPELAATPTAPMPPTPMPPAPNGSAPVAPGPQPLDLPTEQTAPAPQDLPVGTAPPAPQDVPTSQGAPAAPTPKKRRSLARRMVRRILGPDLLRKDPKHR